MLCFSQAVVILHRCHKPLISPSSLSTNWQKISVKRAHLRRKLPVTYTECHLQTFPLITLTVHRYYFVLVTSFLSASNVIK